MVRAVLLGVLTFTVAFVGCISGENGDEDDDTTQSVIEGFYPEVSKERLPLPDIDFTTAYDPTHGGDPDAHRDPTQHAWEYGLELVGYHPLTDPTEGGLPTGYGGTYIAIDTWSTYACVAHWVGGGTGGAEIIDIADPADPKHIASAMSGMVNSDCMFSDDGDYLFIGAYLGASPGLPVVPAPIGDAGANGISVYDVKEKGEPEFLFHDEDSGDANQYHNVFTVQMDDTHYIFQTYTGNILEFDEQAMDLKIISSVPYADHDIWVGNHPVSGEWIMITGAGGGVTVYNVDDPADPVQLGTWESHDRFTGWHRQWPILGTVGGRALMLVAGEEGCASDPTYYTVLDYTDPLDIIEMGHWTIPTGCETQHEFESFDGYFATANYHQGLWVIDIGTLERAMDPATMGYYLPHNDPVDGGGTVNQPGASNPNVWGAAFDDRGYIITADSYSGLYILKFGATEE